MMRQQDLDCVDVGVSEELAIVTIRLLGLPLLLPLVHQVAIGITHRRQLGTGMIEIAEHLQAGDAPATDQTDVHPFERYHHGWLEAPKPYRLSRRSSNGLALNAGAV